MHVEIEEAVSNFELRNLSSAVHVQAMLDIENKNRTSLFPWRGQFSPQLVEHLLADYSTPKSTVLDPFCGSGTVLAEASQFGLSAVGYDINPAAYLFAAMHQLSLSPISEREEALKVATQALFSSGIAERLQSYNYSEADYHSSILALEGASLLISSVVLMLSMGNGRAFEPKKLFKALQTVAGIVKAMPCTNCSIVAQSLDCRSMPLMTGSIDLVVTSPPYINVFNYHQNYRPALEHLGWQPLKIAVAEIGANRKHRQNRFLTVIQYAMDMGLALQEMRRVLTASGRVVLIVGRCSSVRRVTFPNAMMLALVAQKGQGFLMVDWKERQFLNRFGERIYEDVLILEKDPNAALLNAVDVGRSVGVWALERGLPHADREATQDIENALSHADQVRSSPLIQVPCPAPYQSIPPFFSRYSK